MKTLKSDSWLKWPPQQQLAVKSSLLAALEHYPLRPPPRSLHFTTPPPVFAASWGDIAQNSTKRRPASAPTVKRDFARPRESSLSARGGGARLVDVSTRKDGQMSFFRRTEEIRAVVGLMREAEKVRASALRGSVLLRACLRACFRACRLLAVHELPS